jgi:hypothetical protein
LLFCENIFRVSDYSSGFGDPRISGMNFNPNQCSGRVCVLISGFRFGCPDNPPDPNPPCCHPYTGDGLGTREQMEIEGVLRKILSRRQAELSWERWRRRREDGATSRRNGDGRSSASTSGAHARKSKRLAIVRPTITFSVICGSHAAHLYHVNFFWNLQCKYIYLDATSRSQWPSELAFC